MKYKITLFNILFFLLGTASFSQVEPTVQSQLEEMAETNPKLTETLRIDVTGLTLYDLLTTIAEEHALNVSADHELNQLVTTNFYEIQVLDVFLFLIKEYDLEVKIVNGIIVFNKKEVVEIKETPPLPKPIDVSYNPQNNFLSVRLRNDSLPRVAQAITDKSGYNIVLAPGVKTKKISAYILNRPFDQVMEMMAKSNSLTVTKNENNFYYLDAQEQLNVNQTNADIGRASLQIDRSQDPSEIALGSFFLEKDENGFLNIQAYEANVADILAVASKELNVNYFMYDRPTELLATLNVTSITYEDLLNHIFKGAIYTYDRVENLYLIGKHKTENLRQTELVQLENRTIETVLATLPASITANLEVKEFIELNGFVVSGSQLRINEFKDYIYEIDKVVPVVKIEVIIVEYKKAYNINTGLQLGIDNTERTTSGVLYPTTDVTMNASSVNSLIDAFNGFGWINLGKVAENFYANLKLMENNSLIDVKSTPKLVTLNGHEATSSIGETNYYFEQNNRLINTGITDNILQSGTWKATEANLSIYIKPYVSKNENVTLSIRVEKSSFLGRAGEDAPPAKATRSFESIVRVGNNEMILLGGLDELSKENSGTGAPLLSRIPIIKWFFSNRTKGREKSKLHIFIRPTIIY